ncbi:hypothetical protein CCHR01_07316 [Colletotrichum chrysophilum]|uniref:C2H2-type domain-containing protein n=1 Tax=Colletotrichum chrysophilum TaxID=1836956 RepID=A0AAD9ALF8_9PEZI|nr:hypothetical protein CCHR01_07316 [Colletotrichum chrysophilum]
MRKHYKSHFNLPRFVCLCGKKFTKKDNLNRHADRFTKRDMLERL